ncbi:hypothetical protein OHB93_05875 [Microbacterium sp. No. 7]|uniref:hypothetical protein n=1 Tax=Microbacterium sp. No. 7 TaxID=1714373 RepID=UPI003008F3C2
MDDARRATLADLPSAPAWRWTASEITLIVGIPLIAYIGGVAAAAGSTPGFVLVCFAAVATVTLQALRVIRRNQPRVPAYTAPVAVFVAVVTILTGRNLLQFAPHTSLATWLWPAIPVALFIALVALIRRGRR